MCVASTGFKWTVVYGGAAQVAGIPTGRVHIVEARDVQINAEIQAQRIFAELD